MFQFSFAQVLIISTLLIGSQIRYMLNKDLGFQKDAVVYFNSPSWEPAQKILQLKNTLNTLSEVEGMAFSEEPPVYTGWSSALIEYSDGQEKKKLNAYQKFCDTNYLDFYGITLIEGRNLQVSDSVREFLINQTMASQMGFSSAKEAIGQVIRYNDVDMPIVGVVKDFQIQSLHNKLEPVMMANQKDFRCFNVRLANYKSGEDLRKSLIKVESAWKKTYPEVEFKYQFLDDTIKNFYNAEQRTVKLSRTATGLAIFISCLGLFGLASFTTTQRIKEIGIRKVFGASIAQIVKLLSWDFILLVLIAFIIAAPIAWFSIQQWLTGFEYKSEPGLWMFLVTALLAIALAFATVSYQTVSAARRNPADSLRNE